MKTIQDVPMLLRREIEAKMIAPFYDAFVEEIGKERTDEIVRKVIADMARQAGAAMVKEKPEGKNVLTFFKESVTPRFAAGGALEPEYKELSDTRVLMDIKHCAYVQMYKDMGRADLGPLLSCQRDEFLFKGMDPRICFKRTGTIMEGNPVCDFCLELQNRHEG